MMKIGLLSDTHSFLEDRIFEIFKDVDEIWHAGDIGSLDIIDQLESFKPCRLVYGNIDNVEIRMRSHQDLSFEMEGQRIYLNHYGGTPAKYDFRAIEQLNVFKPSIFICGHSHILRVLRDPKRNNMLFINPGAAGTHGFHKMRTCIRFTLHSGQIPSFEVIELGLRGR